MLEVFQSREDLIREYGEFLDRLLPEVVKSGFQELSNKQDIDYGNRLTAMGEDPHKIVDEAVERYGGMDKFHRDVMEQAMKRSIG